ncbi:hypothetical protein HK098_007902, partial [Nowakowskiella sp. JEL0407]
MLSTLKEWNSKFGSKYNQLDLGCKYVEFSMKIKLEDPNLHFETPSETRERQERIRMLRKQKYLSTINEMDETIPKINENVTSMREAFNLLIPDVDEFMKTTDKDIQFSGIPIERMSRNEMIQAHGLGSSSYKLVIEINPSDLTIKETEENTAIFDVLRDGVKLLIRQKDKVSKWIDIISKAETEDRLIQNQYLKKGIDIKQELQELETKATEIGVKLTGPSQIPNKRDEPETESDDDDEEFEEIEIPDKVNFDTAFEFIQDNQVDDPVYDDKDREGKGKEKVVDTEDAKDDEEIQTEREVFGKVLPVLDYQTASREDLLAIAPVVEYDDDLYFWDKNEVHAHQSGIEIQRFSGTNDPEMLLPNPVLEQLRTRKVFAPKPVKKEIVPCRAMRKDGKLCQRRDMVKCPFHGIIIPRDDNGNPINPTTEPDQPTSTPQKQLWEIISDDVLESNNLTTATKPSKGRKFPDGVDKYGETALLDVKSEGSTPKNRLLSNVVK